MRLRMVAGPVEHQTASSVRNAYHGVEHAIAMSSKNTHAADVTKLHFSECLQKNKKLESDKGALIFALSLPTKDASMLPFRFGYCLGLGVQFFKY